MVNIRKTIKKNIRRIKNTRKLRAEIRKLPVRTDRDEKAILIMIDSFYREGAQRVASILANDLSGTYSVTALCNKKSDAEYPVSDRVKIIYMPHFEGRWSERDYFETCFVRKLKQRLGIDVSISFLFPMNRLNVNSRHGEKTICSERNNPLRREPEKLNEIRQLYEDAGHVVFQSQFVRDLFSERVQQHSSIILNPIDVRVKRKQECSHRIVNIGRLHPQKNQALLIRAFHMFYKDHPEYRLSIYGEGGERQRLEALIQELDLDGSVTLHGNIDHIHEAVSDAEMFVLSSDFEGLPNAMLECMMMGFPCISTAYEGSSELITNYDNGILTEAGNAKALAAAMTALAEDPALRETLSSNAMTRSEPFHKDRVLTQWRALIEHD